jgi:hypothetical protein
MTQQQVIRRLTAGLILLILAAVVSTIIHPEPFVTGWNAVLVGGAVAVGMVLLLAFVGVPFAFWAASLPDERDQSAAPRVTILPPETPRLANRRLPSIPLLTAEMPPQPNQS